MNAENQQRFESMLNDLNSTQKESVLSDDNTLQILAGPGSGKTKVLTCRVAYFVIKKQIQPRNIVVVTFTNKAAAEMKKRLEGLIGAKQTEELMIGTFHAICCRILRQHASSVQLDSNFTMADNDMSKQILARLRKDRTVNINEFTRKTMQLGAIWGLISKAKNKGETCAVYAKLYGKDFKTKDIATLYVAYERELKKLNLVDFDNLLIKACELLQQKRFVLSHIKAILVDEYQDTNIVQYNLIKLMFSQDNRKCLTIVGDPDQSIYGFRSAEPQNFIKMQKEYSNTGVINMEQNYRSTSTILNAALHVISHDKSRIEKSLHTDNPIGKPILKIQTSDESAQAQFVAMEIKKIIDGSKGMVGYKDFAVLMRMNATSQQFEQCFRANKIPFTIVGGDRFFNRVEVKDILAYIRFAYNPKDTQSFTRIINVPKRGVGDVNLQKIIAKNDTDGTDLLDTILDIGMGNARTFNRFIKESMLELGSIIQRTKTMIDNDESIPDIIKYILGATKYFAYLQQNYFADHEARWGNVGELISIAQQSRLNESDVIDISSDDSDDDGASTSTIKREDDTTGTESTARSAKFADFIVKSADTGTESVPKLTVSEFLEYCDLCSDQKELEDAEGGKVVIATLHASKGLEWPCVFIATCNEDVIPHKMSDSVDEECRLLYVGMTRSKFLLYCLSPRERISWGGTVQEPPSHFLNNMDKSLFNRKPHEWDNSMRLMLGKTIGREVVDETFSELPKKRPSDGDIDPIDSKKQRCE
ncbi:ATP-dependent DNA helicase PcrA-like [Bradysia coprophila]|uniref:ATP-dependent DNA helicase PcrA-like n=1 Tax=Bradysia coprophila TaxID=38358 RepID=UPI00187DB0CC|nr:ATP-dependent DNA helicase PcrA-like [Bradysia coprophila]